MTIYYADGFSDTTGDDPLSYADDVYLLSDGGVYVFYVSSATGNDTTGTGTRSNPYATIVKALTVAGDFDVIFVRAEHEETFTATQTIASRTIIIGEGTGTSRPLLTPNVASNGDMWTVTGAAHIRNLRFAASAQANTSPTVDASGGVRISYCDFECGQYDDGVKVSVPASSILRSCTFTSAATSTATRPYQALVSAGWAFGCTFTAGTYGWQDFSILANGWDNVASGPVGIGITGICQVEMSGDAYYSGSPAYISHAGLGRLGHPLVANAGLFIASGDVVWVDSTHAQALDAAGYGTSPDRPYATLKYAINTGALLGLFIVSAGHTETIITAPILVDQATAMIVGVGTGVNRPIFTAGDGVTAIDLNGLCAFPLLANVQFAKSTVATSSTRVSIAGSNGIVHNSAFDSGSLDVGASVSLATGATVWASTFTSVATSSTTQPEAAVVGDGSPGRISLFDCTFDGGAKGWSNGRATNIVAGDCFIENASILRDACVRVVDAGGYGAALDCLVQVSTTTGVGRVQIE